MEWFANNWYCVVIAVILAGGIAAFIIRFSKLTKEERYKRIQGWLLQAVLLAEREFGSKTGKLKLSFVYDKFCEQLPWLARVIPFALFSAYVDDALELMRSLIASNSAIASVVERGDANG